MGGATTSRWLTAVGLLTLLLASLCVPHVAAAGGEATIEASSITLGLSEQTESATVSYSFDAVEQTGQSAEVTAHSTLKSIAGTVIESVNETKTVALNGVETFTVTFSSLPYGYSLVETTLSGDVGQNSSTHLTSFNRTIQRLVPLDVGLAPGGDFTFTGLDSEGEDSGNLTVNDGDRINVHVPVLNNGDYAWSGSMSVMISSDSLEEMVNLTNIDVAPMSSTVVSVNSSIAMTEGTGSISVSLNATGDNDASDEERTVSFTVSPPPLPLLDASLDLVTTEYAAGDVLTWNLTMHNNGTRAFSGSAACMFGEVSVLNQTIDLAILSSETLSFTTQARPAELTCNANGMRLSIASNLPLHVNFSVVSAVFESAGSTTPGVLGGPWHAGDSATFSMLVRNHGDIEGSVALECTTSQATYTSPTLMLAVDAAGEVAVVVPLLNPGDQTIEWRLVSVDGSIDEGLNGSVSVPVAAKQVLAPSVDNVTWDALNGVTMEWSVELGEGVDRPVRIRLGYFNSGETYLLDYEVMLAPGLTSDALKLGFIDADRVTVRVDAMNWSEAFGPSSDSKSVPSERPFYRISMSELASPSRPAAGQSATIQVTVSNTGEVAGIAGEILLLGEDLTLYGTKSTSPLDAGESDLLSFTLSWPDGTRVKLEAVWSVDGQQIIADESFTSSDVIAEESGFEMPWMGVLGGIALAGAVIAAMRIQQNQGLKPSSKSKKPSQLKSSSKNTTTPSDVKIQVGCPECARQLRVPASYNGSVRCPDCSNKFDVVAEEAPAEEEEELDEPEDEQVEVVEEKVEVSCPECAQSLRVPSSYAGSVRCPACEHVFKAKS